jgi:hypothetical protein
MRYNNLEVLFLGNPENGIYIGSLNEDIDLVYFKNQGLYGIHFADKPIMFPRLLEGPKYNLESLRFLPEPCLNKLPLETEIKGLRPNEWSKYSHESDKIIGIAANEGYNISFEGNIRPAIIEILDSIREVHKKMVADEDEPLQELIEIKDWKPCVDCECYQCFKLGECGVGCTNPNKQCVNNILEVLD